MISSYFLFEIVIQFQCSNKISTYFRLEQTCARQGHQTCQIQQSIVTIQQFWEDVRRFISPFKQQLPRKESPFLESTVGAVVSGQPKYFKPTKVLLLLYLL